MPNDEKPKRSPKAEELLRKIEWIQAEFRRLRPFIKKLERRQDWWNEEGGEPPAYNPTLDNLPF